ncbi:hypothetical protein TspCOW1_21070 [Thiohalobacter sp. COW1]|uniref:family 10 glycosylhydrolase n=1 Tax=Thiohalobacter sp. COW1 TaxID=2795687 RepID=UPI001914FFCF|nr:family 10 glycosylhydrolase [Thiohalobacter sp. COW1]BCO32004.1 hypothetical protein TspCOW1_21070 [Thiohalobacter sp. COW1]
MLDIEWGKGGGSDWDGGISVHGGTLVSAEPLLLNKEDSIESITSESITWKSLVSGASDAIVLRLEGDERTLLRFRRGTEHVDIRISELLDGPERYSLPESQGLIDARRSRSSVFELKKNVERYVFSPGETLRLQLGVDLLPAYSRETIKYELCITDDLADDSNYRECRMGIANRIDEVFSIDESVALPVEEGVYSLRLTSSEFPVELSQYRLQFVVIDPYKQVESMDNAGSRTRVVDYIDASKAHPESVFRDDGESVVKSSGGVTYRGSGTDGESSRGRKSLSEVRTSWFAYRLKVDAPGKPHRLEITYPADVRMRYVVSLFEDEKYTRSENLVDQGIVSDGGGKPGDVRTKEIIFWPRTHGPAVAFVNALTGSRASVVDITLKEYTDGLPDNSDKYNKEEITIGPYFEESHLPRHLGGAPSLDNSSGLSSGSYTDWTAYYEAVTRLAQMLKYRGENAAMFPVLTYGASLYPSEYIDSSDRYDTGINYRDGRHPQQKDIVELILRVFDRDGLRFIPVFAFYSRLPGVEAHLEKHPSDSDGVLMRHRNGEYAHRALRFAGGGEFGPAYNPLHPVVQGELTKIINEFVDRYGEHDSLTDIAIQINTTGWTQYPGLDWGYDAYSLTAFTGEFPEYAGGTGSHGSRANIVDNIFSDEGARETWVRWRGIRVAEFYRELNDIVGNAGADRKLVAAYMNIFSSRYTDIRPRQALKKSIPPERILAEKAVSPSILNELAGMRIWRPIRVPYAFTRKPDNIALFSVQKDIEEFFIRAGSDGAVEFNDYFESKAPGISSNWWWDMRYKTVATVQHPEMYMKFKLPEDRVYMYGGWQFLQH